MNALSGIKCWGWRQSLIGDSIMALPLLTWAEKRWPGSFKYWQIARKCSQAAPLYLNHPLINELVISDCDEGMGPRDHAIAASCHIRVDTMPQHPDGDRVWVNYRDIYHETARMAGLTDEDYATLTAEEKRPHLVQWFTVDRKPKGTIGIFAASAYGKKQDWHSRFPSRQWYVKLLRRLVSEDYRIIQFGHPNDFLDEGGAFNHDVFCADARELEFFQQIKEALGCDLVIGTDSGSTLVVGAYNSVPVISLLTNHTPGHTENLLAFSTNSLRNRSFVGLGSADNISVDEVAAAAHDMVKT